MNHVGRAIPRLEVRAKVTGRTEYVHNLRLPGMLYGKVFRSTVPHGRIRSIDTSAAQTLEGVHRVVTGADIQKLIPNPYYGPAFHDQPILALEKVRHVGEPVAVVLAEDPHIADQAVQLISAEYDELPAVYDEVEALKPDIIVHDVLKPAGTFADLKHLKDKKGTNVALDYHLKRGDVDAAFARADHVFEHTFKTQQCLHLPFEPFVSVAEPGDNVLTIHSSNQTPSFVRTEVARLFGWPENRVRVKVPFLGGGFGAKVYVKLEALVAALAMLVRRPVKIALTMEEQFYMITKHPTTFRIKSGVTKDGKVIARTCEVYWNGGAYADIGPRVTQKSGFTAAGPYDIENVKIDSFELYTNRTPAGALRGFGIPQLVWAYESHTDLIARELGIDPVEFRRKNILREGRPQASGTAMKDAAIAEVLDAVATRMNWTAPFDRGSGNDAARARHRHRLQGLDLADHVGRHRQRQRRRQHQPHDGHDRHGPGLRHRDGADGRRGARHRARDGARRASRHRHHALRHGHARLALAVPHGQRGAARGRGRAQQAARARGRGRAAGGHQLSAGGDFQETLRHAGRQRHRLGELCAATTSRPIRRPACRTT